ncbi:MAG: homoserine kinase, partial [Candidatus Eremiobacteraeota bacterium]|nr:homoserine kinase [Candidatus Eremiobacteraeota bacterium]
DELARAVAELEGHPDNALAAWYGGAVVVAFGDDGLTVARFPPPAVTAVVVVPEIVLSTAQARELMPQTFARADAVHNVQRAALLGAALAAGRIDLLRAAVRDKLHQPYRAGVIPGLAEILELDDPAVVAIALSGAGPSVLALVHDEPRRIGGLIAALFAARGVRSAVLTPPLASVGLLVTSAGG